MNYKIKGVDDMKKLIEKRETLVKLLRFVENEKDHKEIREEILRLTLKIESGKKS
jgi:predicted component of type VI protein secretion system